MKKGLVVFLILTTLLVSFGIAEDNYLWIDGVNLSLGMKKELVMQLFSKKHDLQQVEDQSTYLIKKKGESPPSDFVGQIAFKEGKLSFASQIWGRYVTKDSLDMANSIYSAISGILNKEGKILRVKTETNRSPDMILNSIELVFTNKTIVISIADGRNIEKSVIIQENLSKN